MLHFDWDKHSLETADEKMRSFIAEIYRSQRYLQTASDTALLFRLDGLIANIAMLDFYGVPNLILDNQKGTINLVELLEEFRLRGIQPEANIKTSVGRFLDGRKITDVEKVIATLKRFEGTQCLFKFTKQFHVDSILRGEIRFITASSCNADGLNSAIRDDESTIEHNLLNLRMVTASGTAIPVKGNKITRRAHSDYYVSCFSVCCDPKMFTLFEYDACVVIKSVDRFVKAIIDRYHSLYPTFHIEFGQVEYIDPFKQLKTTRPLEFCKTSGFAYQKEFRFVSFSRLEHEYQDVPQVISIDPSHLDCEVIKI